MSGCQSASSKVAPPGATSPGAAWAASLIPRVLRLRRGADLRPELLHLIEPGGRRRHPGFPQRVRLHRPQAGEKPVLHLLHYRLLHRLDVGQPQKSSRLVRGAIHVDRDFHGNPSEPTEPRDRMWRLSRGETTRRNDVDETTWMKRRRVRRRAQVRPARRSEEHTSELQSLMRISYAVFCLKKKK